ncbi:unnamed protein product [Paramecium pentaurelia]|uniref:Protein kinase domain-containing protein n=1 Tax=Paramecium pentaurelia TaxID=43138 RepID=A0A8S1U5Q4_9CILI|nr:unnamed protein product [Paramecium pentaurelia]
MLWKQFSRRSISPQNKENLNQQVITRRRDSKISNRYHDNSSQLTIIENYQIPKQPKLKTLDPLFDETLWKINTQDLTFKLFKESIIDRTIAFKEIYMVGKQIGSGSYASVRLCADKLTLKSYALKIYNKSNISSSRQKSILREIRILQMIKHPNIINIYNVIETNNHINLLLEYIDGKQLNTLKGYNLKQALYQIASALNYLHARHITHRDIKIENILYSDGQVKLIDFGFSTLFSNSIKKKIYCGTPSYMAPEIVTKQYYRGPPADIWAFGIVIYYLTQGYFPFKGSNDKELFQLIMQCKINFHSINDHYLQDLLYQMLQFDPENRISAAEILLHPWFLDNIKSNSKSQKSSCTKINSPKQINPYQQYQSTVKKNDKASIEYQLDHSQIRKGVVQSYMSSVASNKSPILRRRDSGNQTFDKSSNSVLYLFKYCQ